MRNLNGISESKEMENEMIELIRTEPGLTSNGKPFDHVVTDHEQPSSF